MANIEIRGDTVVIDGYVNVTGRDSRPIPDGSGGYFIERIERGTFQRAVNDAEEIQMLLNHDKNRVLGRTGDNLTLREDVIGLRAHAVVSDPEVVEKARRHELRGWSFGFSDPVETRSETAGSLPLRRIQGLRLREVSLIDTRMRPVYESTTVEARAEGGDSTLELRAAGPELEYPEEKKTPEKSDDMKRLQAMIARVKGE